MLTMKIVFAAALCVATCLAESAMCQDMPFHASSTNEAERIAAEIAGWLKPCLKRSGMDTVRDGGSIYIYGTFGILPSIFDSFDIVVAIYAGDKEVSFVGYLPTRIPKERRKEMLEFIFRGEVEYGISPASMILGDNGSVRCQAWMPFESFALQPKETKWRLMGAVVDKLWSFSDGVAAVALGGDPEDAVRKIRRISNFEGGEEAASLKKTADADTKAILARCFDKDAQITMDGTEDSWLDRFSGVVRDIGGRHDVLPYSLIVKEGMVWNICKFPEAIPDDIVGEVADVLMRKNENLKYSLFGMDFDTGRMWCHYALPVAVIPEGDTNAPRNLYGVFIKTKPVTNVALNSEAMHSAMIKALLHGGDGQTAMSAQAVDEAEQAVELPLLTKMLNAYDDWEAARLDLSNTNAVAVATRRRIASRKYMKYCGDNQTEEIRRKAWPFDVEGFERDLAEKIVRDECGLYRVIGDCNEYDEGTADDGNVAVRPSIRWVNRKIEAWATNALDSAYRRLSGDEAVRLLDAKSVTDGTFAWAVGTNEYFVIQRNDEDHAFESRDYIYMCRDGAAKPKIAASFNSMPNSKAMYAVRSCMDADDMGQNNVAALMWNGVMNRGEDNGAEIKKILEMAGELEVVIENLELFDKEEVQAQKRRREK